MNDVDNWSMKEIDEKTLNYLTDPKAHPSSDIIELQSFGLFIFTHGIVKSVSMEEVFTISCNLL
jgi:hypothetical protein